ncbi:MAG: 16S rRNA methyltransferase [Rhodanobacter denitrificans]|uniref:16S rRNA methyltransferase n=1 Tax=Rhodanobacter denitrificans TaxID=666685 RepID=A0A2W5KEP7_9GAMM|nr:MAG: 16S rRNA methyltransferase [Rhodanobacter denitrificans]
MSPVAPPATAEAALDALFVPFADGTLTLPAARPVLFLGARAGVWTSAHREVDWHCVQGFKPFADALGRRGLGVSELAESDRYAQVLVLPPRQRDQARALFAAALHHAAADAVVVAAVANLEGARSAEADFERLAGPVRVLSKHKCRVFWSLPGERRVDAGLAADWRALDRPRRIGDGDIVSRPGLFAWDRIDPASRLLAETLPASLAGRVADLGAGYGYLSMQVLARCPAVRAIDLYEADARALAPARLNLERAARDRVDPVTWSVHWHDVTAGLPQRYDAIVSNPPFHQGRAGQPELGQAFIAAAADALTPRGRLWLVANRHLPYELELARRFGAVDTPAERDGFKVITAGEVRR